MSENTSNTVNNKLYPNPFSKEYWKQAASELKKPKILVFAALMIAIRVVLKAFGIPIGVDLKINIAFFINAFGAMVFGPVVALLAAAISDTLGCILFPQGVYFFPFIFVEMAGSLIFALFLYRTQVTTWKVILSRFCICFFVNICMNTPIMMLYYKIILGKYYALIDLPRFAKNLAAFPIESLLLILFLKAVIPVAKKYGYVFTDTEKLKLTGANLVVLGILLCVGIATVFGYSVYSYNHTSLSASYSATQRTTMNTTLRDIILEKDPTLGESDSTVAIIESAYPKFRDPGVTYTVAIYSVDQDELEANIKENLEKDPKSTYSRETLDTYSKSKAKADDCLKNIGYVTIVLNKETNEIISYTFK